MGTSVSLQQTALAVEPGQSVSTEMRVRNTGDVVDQFSFQPLGDAAAWVTVEPPTVRLFPETDAVVTVSIAPPRESTSTPGISTWAVKATPKEDPNGAAVGEGTVDVGTFVELGAELQPMTARGRFAGRYEVAVDNKGNLAMPVRINGNDTEQVLGFDVDPPQIDSQPGSATFTKIRVKPATKIWRGAPKTHPFQIVVEPQARVSDAPDTGDAPVPAVVPHPPIVVNGNLLQEPILPKWLLKALLALLALLLLLFILWKTLLEPRVESAAREVAQEEVAPVSSAVAQIQPEVSQAAAQAQEAAGAAEEAAGAAEAAAEDAGAGGGGGGGGGGVLTNVFNETSEPTHFRLEVNAGAGAANTASSDPQPAATTFALTDLILQNPGGDVGRIRILIAGTPILESALENFRDLDFHFVAPYVVNEGEQVTIEVTCAPDQIVPGDPCVDAVSFAGFTTTVTVTSEPAG